MDPLNPATHTAGAAILDFWQWAFSDLTSNTLRGIFAEWLVARACGVAAGVRTEWDAFDIKVGDIQVEVKSSAYRQSWKQSSLSKPQFTIRPTRAWTSESGFEQEIKRQAHVYVFCLLAEQHEDKLNPLDTTQWQFLVLPTRVLNERAQHQKTIGLGPLLGLGPTKVAFEGIRDAVLEAGVSERPQ